MAGAAFHYQPEKVPRAIYVSGYEDFLPRQHHREVRQGTCRSVVHIEGSGGVGGAVNAVEGGNAAVVAVVVVVGDDMVGLEDTDYVGKVGVVGIAVSEPEGEGMVE